MDDEEDEKEEEKEEEDEKEKKEEEKKWRRRKRMERIHNFTNIQEGKGESLNYINTGGIGPIIFIDVLQNNG